MACILQKCRGHELRNCYILKEIKETCQLNATSDPRFFLDQKNYFLFFCCKRHQYNNWPNLNMVCGLNKNTWIGVNCLILINLLWSCIRMSLFARKYTLKYLGNMSATILSNYSGKKKSKCGKMLACEEFAWKVYGNSLYYLCNFSVSLKLFQNKRLWKHLYL